jgi:hypothetical protein
MCARTLLSVIGEAEVPGVVAGGCMSAHALITHVSPMMARAFEVTWKYYLGCIAVRWARFAVRGSRFAVRCSHMIGD